MVRLVGQAMHAEMDDLKRTYEQVQISGVHGIQGMMTS